jgi:hypothetical protein
MWPVRKADNLGTFMCRLSTNPVNRNLLVVPRARASLYMYGFTFTNLLTSTGQLWVLGRSKML